MSLLLRISPVAAFEAREDSMASRLPLGIQPVLTKCIEAGIDEGQSTIDRSLFRSFGRTATDKHEKC